MEVNQQATVNLLHEAAGLGFKAFVFAVPLRNTVTINDCRSWKNMLRMTPIIWSLRPGQISGIPGSSRECLRSGAPLFQHLRSSTGPRQSLQRRDHTFVSLALAENRSPFSVMGGK